MQNDRVGGRGPLRVLGYLTVNETGPAGVQEPTIGAARPGEEHLAIDTGPPAEGDDMKAVVERCAGIDIAKKVLNVCLLTGAADLEPQAAEVRNL